MKKYEKARIEILFIDNECDLLTASPNSDNLLPMVSPFDGFEGFND